MQLHRPSLEQAPACLQAMVMVGRATKNGLGDAQRAFLAASQRIVLGTNLDIDGLEEINMGTLASTLPEPNLRRQLIQSMVVMSLVDGPPAPEAVRLIRSFAETMDVDEPAVKITEDLASKSYLMFMLDFYRRSHFREYIANTYRMTDGIMGMAKAILGFKGFLEDPKLASRFHALRKLPENSLGHALYSHYRENGFAFPGEKYGFPLGGVWHDFSHVLSGNPATPEGEIRVAAFQAGIRREGAEFFTILSAILIHVSGINVSFAPQEYKSGRLADKTLAENVLSELERGSRVNVDLGANWDFWPLVGRSLADVRDEFGVIPLSRLRDSRRIH